MNKPEINRDSLIQDLKGLIISAVHLQHVNPEHIQPETTFGPEGLNLDSVDILEIVVAVEQKYKIKVKDAEVGRQYFGTISGIAEYIMEQRA